MPRLSVPRSPLSWVIISPYQSLQPSPGCSELKRHETFDGPPVDSTPVTRLLFFIAPSPRAHLELLGQLSSALRRGELRRLIVENAADADIFAALAAVESVANDSNGKGSRT